jgi:hypothetical protein
VILQIQDNGNDQEDLVEIDDMLLDELDLEELGLSGLLVVVILRPLATKKASMPSVH